MNAEPQVYKASQAGGRETVFYDDHCGICARSIDFVRRRDPAGRRFEFQPLGGEAFRATIDEQTRENLPDSVVVRTADNQLLTRSAAVIHVLGRLGGPWRLLGGLMRIVPRFIRDRVYDEIARQRHHFRACRLA